ncbi:hypothetical protein PVAND_017450 [Polypedilum vanderplanki]|uniref:Uncharacterized protein n=1 Tax=Polypedilum vanderplanki TaxID=319348 RepID=A0A9J6BJ27_POLVA|nr:hypothetical protein PVAND_017450 [Polypedilum vanderplanki]
MSQLFGSSQNAIKNTKHLSSAEKIAGEIIDINENINESFKKAVSGKITVMKALQEIRKSYKLIDSSLRKGLIVTDFNNLINNSTIECLKQFRDAEKVNKKFLKNFAKLFGYLFNTEIYSNIDTFIIFCKFFFDDLTKMKMHNLIDETMAIIDSRLKKHDLTEENFLKLLDDCKIKNFFQLTDDCESYKFDPNSYQNLDIEAEAKLIPHKFYESIILKSIDEFDVQLIGKLSCEKYINECLLIIYGEKVNDGDKKAKIIKEIFDLTKTSVGLAWSKKPLPFKEMFIKSSRLMIRDNLKNVKKNFIICKSFQKFYDIFDKLDELKVLTIEELVDQMEEFELFKKIINIKRAVNKNKENSQIENIPEDSTTIDLLDSFDNFFKKISEITLNEFPQTNMEIQNEIKIIEEKFNKCDENGREKFQAKFQKIIDNVVKFYFSSSEFDNYVNYQNHALITFIEVFTKFFKFKMIKKEAFIDFAMKFFENVKKNDRLESFYSRFFASNVENLKESFPVIYNSMLEFYEENIECACITLEACAKLQNLNDLEMPDYQSESIISYYLISIASFCIEKADDVLNPKKIFSYFKKIKEMKPFYVDKAMINYINDKCASKIYGFENFMQEMYPMFTIIRDLALHGIMTLRGIAKVYYTIAKYYKLDYRIADVLLGVIKATELCFGRYEPLKEDIVDILKLIVKLFEKNENHKMIVETLNKFLDNHEKCLKKLETEQDEIEEELPITSVDNTVIQSEEENVQEHKETFKQKLKNVNVKKSNLKNKKIKQKRKNQKIQQKLEKKSSKYSIKITEKQSKIDIQENKEQIDESIELSALQIEEIRNGIQLKFADYKFLYHNVLYNYNEENFEKLLEIFEHNEKYIDKFLSFLWQSLRIIESIYSVAEIAFKISKFNCEFTEKLKQSLTSRFKIFKIISSEFITANENIQNEIGDLSAFIIETFELKVIDVDYMTELISLKILERIPKCVAMKIYEKVKIIECENDINGFKMKIWIKHLAFILTGNYFCEI